MGKVKYKHVNKCCLCNRQTMLFVWTTSRVAIPHHKKINDILNYKQSAKPAKAINEAILFGLPVCFECFKKVKHGGKIIGY